jgi:hypothetical protein
MAARSVLFRLFLAAILIFNGFASAMATVQHAKGPGEPAESPHAEQMEPMAGGAHDGCGDLRPGLVENEAPMIVGSDGAGHGPGQDCCEPQNCQSSCANTCVPIMAPVIGGNFPAPGQGCSQARASWHPSPALPHVMRPPIS